MNLNSTCLWTAWGEVVCDGQSQGRGASAGGEDRSNLKRKVVGREYFVTAGTTSCVVDADCDSKSRCDNLNNNAPVWVCKQCSDIGCAIGKACGSSSDCAEGLSCQNNICSVGSTPTKINNSSFRITKSNTDTVGQTYEAQRQAYLTLESGTAAGADCALSGTCAQGYPCDQGALTVQCAAGLMCDAGVCKTEYSGV